MKSHSHFLKLPGQRVNSSQIEAGVPNPDTFPAFFWIDRSDILAVMEALDDDSGRMTVSTIFCKNGDSFHCTIPAQLVMAKIDKHDQQRDTLFIYDRSN